MRETLTKMPALRVNNSLTFLFAALHRNDTVKHNAEFFMPNSQAVCRESLASKIPLILQQQRRLT
jgi:hypothetical protein